MLYVLKQGIEMMKTFFQSKKLPFIGIICSIMALVIFVPNIAFAAGEAGSMQDTARLFKDQDIWFMLMLVAFLMLFIRKFEWSVCLAVLLTAASSAIMYLLLSQATTLGVPADQVWTQEGMIAAVVCAITVVIGIGVFLGTIKMWQYLLAGALFTPLFMLLEVILWQWLPGITGGEVTDPGGGILVHQFAAYFGLGVALGIREKRAFEEPMLTSKQSVAFVWLATMLLFILWPSFVTALLPLEVNTQVMINCYLSGFGSIIAAYLTCVAVSKKKKVNPLVYTYAMLAGPVASSSTLLLAHPWVSMLIGVVAGVLCTLAFTFLNAWLCKKLKVLDVMGVHNLHGIGGWISLLTGAMLAGNAINVLAGVVTLVLGIVGGCIIGLILRGTRGKLLTEQLFSDESVFEEYNPDPRIEPAQEVDPGQS